MGLKVPCIDETLHEKKSCFCWTAANKLCGLAESEDPSPVTIVLWFWKTVAVSDQAAFLL